LPFAVFFAVVSLASCAAPNGSTPQSTGARQVKVVEFAPGIRLDYRVPQVEIDGEVILREGALELFAYAKAPTPKEHESILLLRSAPEMIYRALGLIGLTPGRPARFDRETKTLHPATGDSVEVRVRYERNGEIVESSACEWMWDIDANRPMKPTDWLFTGSTRTEEGRFAADLEGTVVTVVDFPSSLMALPTSHSDADESLWLRANTDAIPPIGTKVTLLLRPAESKPTN
jgi:hypothetical protein